ncbi:MAG TPA: calcium/sodium antiporter [Thermoanaerobaculaceae bacterium]|nr:calcium/sodium antiporter [Thermoanaerobaculaceae bacterium]
MSLGTFVMIVVGLGLLALGGELLVRGSARLAAAAGISPLVVGLTVVALGTSSPELAVSLRAVTSGQSTLALGNLIGSNIFNILLILGLSALLVPLAVARQLVRRDVPVMIAASLAVPVLGLDGRIGRLDGLLLLAGLIVYLVWLVGAAMRSGQTTVAPRPVGSCGWRNHWVTHAALVIVGLGVLLLGARYMVTGATALARWAGLSDLVIGLTVVAAGTSLPEVAASLIAGLRGERDIAVGNVIGSNIFNLLCVLGGTAAVARQGVAVPPSALRFDIPVMVAVAVACLPILITGFVVSRGEGALLVAFYVAYTMYLALDASGHDALGPYSWLMAVFILPLTALGLAGGLVGWLWRRRC